MDIILYIVGGVFAGLFALIGAMALIGLFLRKDHVATRHLLLDQPPEKVWRAISDFAGQLEWRKDLKAVERLGDRDGKPVWREKSLQGDLTLQTLEETAPSRLVRKIINDRSAFGGRWEYAIENFGDSGSKLRITEYGEIYNPVFRFLSKFFDLHATIEGHMKALAAKFDEPTARIEP